MKSKKISWLTGAGLSLIFVLTLIITTSYLPAPAKDVPVSAKNSEIQIDGKYLQLNIYENGEVKPIADMLAKGCKNDEQCEIENDFKYVVNLPYQPSLSDKKPEDVINSNGGDCDEKSFLFVSLLLQQKHKSVLVVTKEHAFVAVHIENPKNIRKPSARLIIDGVNYYYAEMTDQNGRLGSFNNIRPSAFEVVYDVAEKKEIPLNTIRFSES